jgi:uncharacterized membrane protein YjgN (DUF898 family)
MRFKNLFDAPPPIQRAPLPGENPAYAIDNAQGPPPFNPDAPLADRLAGGALPVACTASSTEFFSIWVVCQFFTFITLGLYAPWAKARKTRYLAQHISLNGRAFDVQLNPMAILKGRLIALAIVFAGIGFALRQPSLRPFLAIAAFAALPWLLSRSMAFRWWRSSFADRRFGFVPDATPLIKPALCVAIGAVLSVIPLQWGVATHAFLVPALNSIGYLTVAMLAPYLTTVLLHLRLSRAQYGKHHFQLETTAWEMYKKLFSAARKGFGFVFLVYMLLMVGSGIAYGSGATDIAAILGTMGLLTITVFSVAAARTQRFNFVMNRLTVGEHLRFESSLDSGKTARKSVRFALLNIITLGLAVPWTTIEMLKWRVQHVRAHLNAPWEDFINAGAAQAVKDSGAIADGLAEQFDFELSL